MGKYDVTYSCGHTGTVNLAGKNTERERQIAWMEQECLCPDCYKAVKRKEEKEKGFLYDVRLPHAEAMRGKQPIFYFVFSGDTMPHKDEIKMLGAKWTDDYPEIGWLGDVLKIKRQPNCWVLQVPVDELETAMAKAEVIGASLERMPSKDDIALYVSTYRDAQNRLNTKRETLGPKPAWPTEFSELWPADHTWNGKFYGRAGSYCVYFRPKAGGDGVKVSISDEIKTKVEEVQSARDEWNRKNIELQ